jgi:hypothetical protein
MAFRKRGMAAGMSKKALLFCEQKRSKKNFGPAGFGDSIVAADKPFFLPRACP